MNTTIVRGALLRELRHDKGMTLRQVSSKAYIALGYLSEIETGHKQPADEMLENVLHALDTDISHFYWMLSLRLGGEDWATLYSKQFAHQ